jgi:tape measure domain-containing protein
MAEKARILLTAEDQTRQAFSSVQRNLSDMQQAVSQIRNVGAAIFGAEIVQSLGEGARAIVAARVEFEKLQNTLGQAVGVGRVGQELAFIRQTAQQLGLEFNSTAASYAKFAAASRGTALEGQQTREVFVGIAQAATALGLSSEETAGALTAIQQIISKGKVSAEELRGQLGERLPGAFQIAARAAGVTTQELDALLQSGSLLADDFLPKFGRQLQVEFADAAARAAVSTQASVNRLTTAFGDLRRELALGFAGDLVKRGIDETATAINNLSRATKEAERNSTSLLGSFIELTRLLPGVSAQIARTLAQRGVDSQTGTAAGALLPPGAPSVREQLAAGELRDLDFGESARFARRAGNLSSDRDALQRLRQQFRSPEQQQRDQIAELRRLGAATGDDVSAQIAEIQRRNARGGTGVDRAAQDARAYVQALNEQVAALQQVSETEKVIAELRDGKLRGATAAQFDEALRFAGQLDAQRSATDDAARALERLRALEEREASEGAANEQAVQRTRDLAAAWRDTLDPLARYTRQLEEIRQLVRSGDLSGPEGLAAEFEVENNRQDAFERLKRGAEETTQAMRGLNLTFETTFEDAILGTKSAGDAFRALANDITRAFLRESITRPLLEGLFGSGNRPGAVGGLFGGNGLGSVIRGLFGFADGGVMTGGGPLPLRKYAAGGIARSAQVAVFGEGDRPEAYVPLPDGRSIPVTMQGGGATIVQNFDMRNSTTSENLVRSAAALGAAQARASLFEDRVRGREAFA